MTTLLSYQSFEEAYVKLRKLEGRIYTDEELRLLPDVPESHRYYPEWQVRKQSAEQLCRFIKKNQPLSILEVGCGNGWLSALMAKEGAGNVLATDINRSELEQATKVFAHIPDLRFENTSMENLAGLKFDMIVFAASVQYFESLTDIISKSILLLKAGGSIHITDTHFYIPGEIKAAHQRSIDYFTQMECPEMATRYFHHSMEDLKNFNFYFIQKPAGFVQKVFSGPYPFYHIVITGHA